MSNSQQPNDNKRILGHLRIFQSVFNDLKMRHEIVTLEDGTKRYAYVYDGIDPYALEDSHFPMTVGLIQDEILKAQQETERAFGGCKRCYGKGYATYSGEYKARGMTWPDNHMKFCDCERGKQIEDEILKARLDELEKSSVPGYFLWNGDGKTMTIADRITELSNQLNTKEDS